MGLLHAEICLEVARDIFFRKGPFCFRKFQENTDQLISCEMQLGTTPMTHVGRKFEGSEGGDEEDDNEIMMIMMMMMVVMMVMTNTLLYVHVEGSLC